MHKKSTPHSFLPDGCTFIVFFSPVLFPAFGKNFFPRAAFRLLLFLLDHSFASCYNAPIGNEGEQSPLRRVSQEKGWPQAGSRPKRVGEIHSGAAR